MSLQERYFNMEKQSNQKDAVVINLRSTISDLELIKETKIARISELCSEIKSLKQSVSDAEALMQQQSQESRGIISMLQIKLHELQTQIEKDRETIDSLCEESSRRDRSQAADRAASTEMQTLLEELRIENAELKNRALESEEVASQLQDYKKRAQMALKQVCGKNMLLFLFSDL